MGSPHHSRDRSTEADDQLLARFVAALERLGEFWTTHENPPPHSLLVGIDEDDWGYLRWRPTLIATDRAELDPIYARIPGVFPKLYERLVLTYRWLDVELDSFLRANPPEPTLAGLAKGILGDPAFVEVLIPRGYVPFGSRGYSCYDPFCFDLKSMKNCDCPIIRFEHEVILCHLRIGNREQVFPSFREMVWATIEEADG
jgi:hypothetical protein